MRAYRPDIDGLRAIAVLAVVLFHIGLAPLGGGYVGVDIFFVISGYLITGIVKREMEENRFTFASFYERRARRILPALFFLLLVGFGLALWVSMPQDLANYGASGAAAVLFSSNIYFFLKTNYFDAAAEFQPLLHTWSLAVEEQFYFLFPPVLWLAIRMKRIKAVVLTILALSLLLSVLVSARAPSFAFYLLPTRAWELMMGAALALGMVPWPSSQRMNEGLSVAALIGLGAAIFFFNDETVFPGIAAVLPCGAAAVLIQSGATSDSLVRRLLSNRLMVGIGLISYSLYLWHWILLAFARQALATLELPMIWAVGVFIGSFVMAYLSWRVVEQPFRNKSHFSRARIFALSGGLGAIVCGILASAYLTTGFLGLRSDETRTLVATQDITAQRAAAFGTQRGCNKALHADGLCVSEEGSGAPTTLVWGDSHAGALFPAVAAVYGQAGEKTALATHHLCPPFMGIYLMENGPSCRRYNESVLRWLEAGEHDLRRVVLIGRWSLYAEGVRPEGESGHPVTVYYEGAMASTVSRAGPEANLDALEIGLEVTLARLYETGLEVIILGDTPEFGRDVPRMIYAQRRFGVSTDPLTLKDVEERSARAQALLGKEAAARGARFVPLASLLCDPVCAIEEDGRALYRDDDHLSVYGAREVLAERLAPILLPAQQITEAEE